ncbi:autotransporter domain-containing protein [Brucella sp. 21LCYQ03]|nr:autotransporter domain-containing protein [Brucella sp. 21LCYQ03]
MKNKLATMLTLAAGTCLSTAGFVTTAQAIDYYDIKDAAGNPFMQVRIFNVGDGFYADGDKSTWNLSGPETDQVLAAVQYWAEMITVIPGNNPAIINLGTYDDPGASALSPVSVQKQGSGTLVEAAITNREVGQLQYGSHGLINVGQMNWAPAPFIASQLPLTPQVDMTSVLIHEVAHALGISSETLEQSVDGIQYLGFPSIIDNWSTHLRDDNGKAAAPDQIIYCNVCSLPGEDEDIFDVREDRAYFTGDHVSEVLAGAMPGIPVRTGNDLFENDPGRIDAPVFSHIELKNSLMSHQNYRNYTNLMEAEVASLQDLGYSIDRRNFFGFSIYSDNQTLINDNPFTARNASGTGYIENSYNMSTLGLGLHVYGSNNSITQRADILSAGAGGGGIRVDGASNDLTVLPGTRIYANGAYARGIMFSYGKDHNFNQRGDVEALGENGIAASFDFGHNSLGDEGEYRGSYFVVSNTIPLETSLPDYYQSALAEVSGPLVTSFDLTGRVAGSYAAIYMSDNAYVGAINVMDGASISGDIISNYDETDASGDQRITALNFGLKADAEGHSTAVADAAFSMAYAGNITGISNLSLTLAGGTTRLTGDHELYNVDIAQNAALTGKGHYLLNSNGAFNNYGTLAPYATGQAITIDGSYIQSETGKLQLAFNDKSEISSLIVRGNADLDGSLAFAPERGWYQNGFTITSNTWLSADTITGSFADVATTLASPTLTATAFDNGSNTYTVSLNRDANAYAQYGDTKNSRSVGAAIDKSAGNAGSGLQSLIAALDFSVPDGSDIRSALPQLTGEAYASTSGALINMSSATRSAVNNRLQQAFDGAPVTTVAVMAFGPDEKTGNEQPSGIDLVAPASTGLSTYDLARYAAWASAFGSWTNQSGNSNAAGSKTSLGGFVSGIDANVYDNWRLGAMAGYSRSTFKSAERAASGSSDNYTLGVYTGTEWAAPHGAVAFRSGLAYTWHKLEMNRSITFPGFSDNLSADYDGGIFQIFGELGYKINVMQRSLIEPYVNLAYVNLRTDGFTETGLNGAALSIHSDKVDTTLSTLGMRASTGFELGNITSTARIDLGWRHAFGDNTPTSTASFAAGSSLFTATGNAIGKDTALIEAGFDFELGKQATIGVGYQGQFGSGLTQNGLNADLRVKF